MTTANTKRMGLAWRIVVWLLAIGWTPLVVEQLCETLFRLLQHETPGIFILVIPYIEFVTMPFTFLAVLIALYKGVNGTLRLLHHDKSESHDNRNS